MVNWVCKVCKQYKEDCYQRSKNTISCRKCESARKLIQINKWRSQWNCYDCSQKKLDTSIYCQYHYIKRKLKNNKCKHLDVSWYYSLIEKQNYKCPYTNLDLVIWVNDSIDHVIPLSKWWTSEESNLVICDSHFNKMKLDRSLEEVYIRCKWFVKIYKEKI